MQSKERFASPNGNSYNVSKLQYMQAVNCTPIFIPPTYSESVEDFCKNIN